MCHVKKQILSFVLLAGGTDSSSCQDPRDLSNCWCIPQCSQISKGTGCLCTCLNNALHGSPVPVQCQTVGADVDTRRTAVFTKSWKPVLKSCHASRCTIRCFWDWSPHHACCWPEFLSWRQHWLSKESEDSLLRWVWWHSTFPIVDCTQAHDPIVEWPKVLWVWGCQKTLKFLRVQARSNSSQTGLTQIANNSCMKAWEVLSCETSCCIDS